MKQQEARYGHEAPKTASLHSALTCSHMYMFVVYAALQCQNNRVCKKNDSPANTCRLFLYSQQDSFMSVGWLKGPTFVWLDNSEFSGPFMRKLFPNTITHLMRRGMRTLTGAFNDQ